MKAEVDIACRFVTKMLRRNGELSEKQLEAFHKKMKEILCARYKHHWHPQNPLLGSGFRCIRINHSLDPVIAEAAQASGLPNKHLKLPEELTLWIDPKSVAFRIGENGSICDLDLDESISQENTSKPSKEALNSKNQESRKRSSMNLLNCTKDVVSFPVSSYIPC